MGCWDVYGMGGGPGGGGGGGVLEQLDKIWRHRLKTYPHPSGQDIPGSLKTKWSRTIIKYDEKGNNNNQRAFKGKNYTT